MFHITPGAAHELLHAAQRSAAPGLGLRIAARELADGALEVGMGFDDERELDHRVELEGLTVLLGAPSRALLDDAVLDYVELAPGRFGFVFVPAAHGGCAPRDTGCSSGGYGGNGGNGGCARCGG